jgi:hypothetical protein
VIVDADGDKENVEERVGEDAPCEWVQGFGVIEDDRVCTIVGCDTVCVWVQDAATIFAVNIHPSLSVVSSECPPANHITPAP